LFLKLKESDTSVKKTRRNDLLLFISLIAISLLAAAILTLLPRGNGTYVQVKVGAETYGRYLISENKEIIIEVGDGYNTLVIQDGAAYIKEASCPDKLCVSHSRISEIGEVIICLPNRVSVTVTN